MRQQITVMGNAIQYGNLGQLNVVDCIIHIDEVSLRGDIALEYIREGLRRDGVQLMHDFKETPLTLK